MPEVLIGRFGPAGAEPRPASHNGLMVRHIQQVPRSIFKGQTQGQEFSPRHALAMARQRHSNHRPQAVALFARMSADSSRRWPARALFQCVSIMLSEELAM